MPVKVLEKEANKMESQLNQLKMMMQKQKEQREQQMRTSGTRWVNKNPKKIPNANNNISQLLKPKVQIQTNKIDQIMNLKQKNQNMPNNQKKTNQNLNNNIKQSVSFQINSNNNNQQNIQQNNSSFISNNKSQVQFQIKDLSQGKTAKVPVTHFLQNLNLQQYSEKFIENGLKFQSQILDITTLELKAMNVLPGHQIKILKGVSKIKEQLEQEQIQHKLEIEEELRKQQEEEQQQKQQKNPQSKYENQDSIDQENESTVILSEQEKNQMFKKQNNAKLPKVTIVTEQCAFDDIQCDLQEIKSQNISCFQCYKLIKDKKKIEQFDQEFCSYNCADQYRQSVFIKCAECQMNCKKDISCFKHGQYYCSTFCLPTLEEEVEEQIRKQNEINKLSEQLQDKKDMEQIYDQHEFMFSDFEIDFTASQNMNNFVDLKQLEDRCRELNLQEEEQKNQY